MRAFVLALMLFFVGGASAGAADVTIGPGDAKDHVGQVVTVEGLVGDVHVAKASGVTFIDMGGTYPRNAFTAVIFEGNAAAFPGVKSLTGKNVDITGRIELYRGRPEIILRDGTQLVVRP